MGAYLSQPNLEKVSDHGSSSRVMYGVSSMQGWRISQEDDHNCIMCLEDFKEAATKDTEEQREKSKLFSDCSLFGVYDGHGGCEVAKYTSCYLPEMIKSHIRKMLACSKLTNDEGDIESSLHVENSGEDGVIGGRSADLARCSQQQISRALVDAFVEFDSTLCMPSVIEHLQFIAMSSKSGKSDDSATDSGEDLELLKRESKMPLEHVVNRYIMNEVRSKTKIQSDFSTPPTSLVASVSMPTDISDLKCDEDIEVDNDKSDDITEENTNQSLTSSSCNILPNKDNSDDDLVDDKSSTLQHRVVRQKTQPPTNIAELCKLAETQDNKISEKEFSRQLDSCQADTLCGGDSSSTDDTSTCTDSTNSIKSSRPSDTNQSMSSIPNIVQELHQSNHGICETESESIEVSQDSLIHTGDKLSNSVNSCKDTAIKNEVEMVETSSNISDHKQSAQICESQDVKPDLKTHNSTQSPVIVKNMHEEVEEIDEEDDEDFNNEQSTCDEDEFDYDSEDVEEEEIEEEEDDGEYGFTDDDEFFVIQRGLDAAGNAVSKPGQVNDVSFDGADSSIGKEEQPGHVSGCTAVVALIISDLLYVANIGDSRCVLCRGPECRAFDMSEDHKPESQVERRRIEQAGGVVTMDGRVNGGLNLSRAFGDHDYKKNSSQPPSGQMISCVPEVRCERIDTRHDRFMVLACDGIWNSMSSQEVVDFISDDLVSTCSSEEPTPEYLTSLCEKLFDKCLAPDTKCDGTGCDNMTCIIVYFRNLTASDQNNQSSSSCIISSKETHHSPAKCITPPLTNDSPPPPCMTSHRNCSLEQHSETLVSDISTSKRMRLSE